ncbi:MAG: winged helix-turn-helix transcriptional regulator [Flavobacteriales bacterium]|nr:winged helix-turn-helix transcriptional regulator [Flavobacteriales bacterium]
MKMLVNTEFLRYTNAQGAFIIALIKSIEDANPYGCRLTKTEIANQLNFPLSTVSKKTNELIAKGVLEYESRYAKWSVLPIDTWEAPNSQAA